MTKIRFAIVGCGRIGNRHAKHIAEQAELVAVCDSDASKASSLSSTYKVPSFGELDELLAADLDIEVISICTPNGLHACQTNASLKAGYHVLCEKPMAIDVHDCGEMINTAEKMNKRLFIVKQNRFNPAIAEVKKIIDDNRLGQVQSVQLSCFWNRNENYYANSDWKGTKELDGGTLYTQFSHFIDLLYWMIGDVAEVNALIANYQHEGIIEFEDAGVVSLKFYNGALGTINYTVNSYGKNMEGSLTVFGSKGTVKIGGQYLNKLEYQHIEGYEIGELPAGNPANEYGEYQGSMSNHDKVYENVISVLQNNGEIATNGFEGLKTVEIIDKIYKSALKNG